MVNTNLMAHPFLVIFVTETRSNIASLGLVPRPIGNYVPEMAKFPRILPRTKRVSVIRLNGAIGASGGRFSSPMLSDAALASVIERAFANDPLAVALAINSPGGSPVQSSMIGARIRRLADKNQVPVYSFCEDVAASGGYWLACAGDHIFADNASVVGSIGVIFAGFGFHDLIERYGIERRVYTAGQNKSTLDPFRPEKEEDIARIKSLQLEIHEAFIAWVKERRGERLTGDENLFTGKFWTAKTGQSLGLVDGIAHLVPKMQEVFGEKVKFDVVAPRRGLFQRLGAPGAADLLGAAEDRALWQRFGV